MGNISETQSICSDVSHLLIRQQTPNELASLLADRLGADFAAILDVRNSSRIALWAASRPTDLSVHSVTNLPSAWQDVLQSGCPTQIVGGADSVLGLPEEATTRLIPLRIGSNVFGALVLTSAAIVETNELDQWLSLVISPLLWTRWTHISDTESDAQERQSDFQSIMDGTEAVIYAKRLDGRYLFINRKYEEIFSLKRSEVIGRTDTEIFSQAPELAKRFMDNDRMVVNLGRSVQFEETAPHTDGLHQYVSVKFPLLDIRGNIRGVAGISTDITERVRAEHLVQSIQERDDEILNAVADGVVLLCREGRIEYQNPAAQKMLGIRRSLLNSLTFAELVMSVDGSGRPRHERSLPVSAALHNQHRTVDQEDVFWRGDGTILNVEYSAVPILKDGHVDGVVVTFRDIKLRLERRRDRRDLKAAQAMQRLLYPNSHPKLPGFDIAGAVFPSGAVCGDYYDYVPRDEHRLAIIVADATGHDMAAALLMVNARANFRSELKSGDDLNTILFNVNETLSHELQVGKFVTTFLTELDSRDRSLTYSGAGHSAILLPKEGEAVLLKSSGLMLGLQSELMLSDANRFILQPGDVVLIATDGLTEAQSPEGKLLGSQAVIECIRQMRMGTAHDILNALCELSRSYTGNNWPQDDATLVVIKATGPGDAP